MAGVSGFETGAKVPVWGSTFRVTALLAPAVWPSLDGFIEAYVDLVCEADDVAEVQWTVVPSEHPMGAAEAVEVTLVRRDGDRLGPILDEHIEAACDLLTELLPAGVTRANVAYVGRKRIEVMP